MTFKPPELDDLTYERLRAELISRIPIVAPEWTDHNPSDPGVAIIELFAWLGEQLGYRLNQVPEANYVALLNLLGTRVRPAQPAATRLALLLGNNLASSDNVRVGRGMSAQSGGSEPVRFEIDETHTLVPAQLATILSARTSDLRDITGHLINDLFRLGPDVPLFTNPDDWADRQLHMVWDGKTPSAVELPAEPVSAGFAPYQDQSFLYLGFRQVPSGFTNRRLRLFVQLNDDEPTSGLAEACDAPDAEDANPPLPWAIYMPPTGAGRGTWVPLTVLSDATLGFTRSGEVELLIPAGVGAIPHSEWVTFRSWPEGVFEQLLGSLQSNFSFQVSLSDLMNGGPAEVAQSIAAGMNQANITDSMQINIDLLNIFPQVPHPLPERYPQLAKAVNAWIRIGHSNQHLPELRVRHIGFNVVRATTARTATDTLLTASATGGPGQRYTLPHRNIQPGTLEVVSWLDDTITTWHPTPYLALAGPQDAVYLLDTAAGAITFGDGIHGRAPALDARIMATHYRHGGGAIPTLPPASVRTVNDIATVPQVTNVIAARGGLDAETLPQARARAPIDLHTQRRAVTREDFIDLTLRTPDARFARAEVIGNRRPYPTDAIDGPGVFFDCEAPGVVTVIPVPDTTDPAPRPSPTEARILCSWLDRARLLTTELHISAPLYVRIFNLRLRVTLTPGQRRRDVRDALIATYQDALSPIRGGQDGDGFPFGGRINTYTLTNFAFRASGVRDVRQITATFNSMSSSGPDAFLVGRPERAQTTLLTLQPQPNAREVEQIDLRPDELPFFDPAGFELEIVG